MKSMNTETINYNKMSEIIGDSVGEKLMRVCFCLQDENTDYLINQKIRFANLINSIEGVKYHLKIKQIEQAREGNKIDTSVDLLLLENAKNDILKAAVSLEYALGGDNIKSLKL